MLTASNFGSPLQLYDRSGDDRCKKSGSVLFFSLLLPALFFPYNLHALEVPPKPDSYVSDWAGMLSLETRNTLDRILRGFDERTSHQVVVASFATLEEESAEDFSIRLAQAWKVGQKGIDIGVILLFFRDERIIRIEVGYGLEAYLTDAQASQIIRDIIEPRFRNSDFDGGVLEGVRAILSALPEGEKSSPTSRENHAWVQTLLLLLLTICFALSVIDFVRYGRYLKEHKLYKQRFHLWGWWFRFAFLLVFLQIILRILLQIAISGRGYSGSRGGFGGGGFSGGGGRFGGGGATGRW